MKSLIVGLASPAQGGKDMVADIIQEELFYTDVTIDVRRFADPLKDLVAKLFGWERNRLDNDIDFKETVDPDWNISPRIALQLIGTNMFRDGPLKFYGINMWVDIMKRRLQKCLAFPEHLIIVPDCRFTNEFETIQDLGGVMVFMDPRPRIVPDEDAHSSELDMWRYDYYDHVIDTGHEKEKTEIEARRLASLLFAQIVGG